MEVIIDTMLLVDAPYLNLITSIPNSMRQTCWIFRFQIDGKFCMWRRQRKARNPAFEQSFMKTLLQWRGMCHDDILRDNLRN